MTPLLTSERLTGAFNPFSLKFQTSSAPRSFPLRQKFKLNSNMKILLAAFCYYTLTFAAVSAADSDLDGLEDLDETAIFGTNPAIADTDGDGLSDGWEVGAGRISIVTMIDPGYEAALAHAASQGSRLFTSRSSDEFRGMRYALRNAPFSGFLWVGLTYKGNRWTWADGFADDSFYWAGQERTDIDSGELYAAMDNRVNGDGGFRFSTWSFDVGDRMVGYIREIGNYSDPLKKDTDSDGFDDASEASAETDPQDAAPKPQFQIIQGRYTWHQAKADAETRGGRLAVLNTQAKIDEANAFLQGLGSWPVLYFGLTDEVTEGQWKWINGEQLSASNWNQGEPNNLGNEDYAMLLPSSQGGRWNDGGGDSHYYLLEFLKQTLTTTQPTHGSITGAGEYDSSTTATLTATPDAGYTFTGWTGDASGTTNPLTLTMDAGKTVGATFAADLSDADADGLTAYDEVTLYHTDPTKADSDNDGLTDAYELGIGRFTVVSGNRTWAQAKAHAGTQGGTLATFASQEEWNLAMQSIGSEALLDIVGLWIGATDEAVEGTWRWVTGEPFVFALWETGQPDNSNNSDYAAVAGELGGSAGKWYDYRATTIRDGYILESGYSTNPSDADSDDDGLPDGAERTAGTNPFKADTDGDGLTDTQEVNLTHTNPKLADSNSNGTNDALDDEDSDGLTNLAEITQHGTDPINADTDRDGINDGAEVAYAGSFYKLVQGTFTYAQAVADATTKQGRVATFPTNLDYARVAAAARQNTPDYLWIGLSDTANEGTWVWTNGSTALYSRWLVGQPSGGATENRVVIMENSTQWADSSEDFQAAGYIFEHVGLDPLNPDTDADGLNDGVEINTHHSSPVKEDTDGDGLSDSAEVNTHGSSPLLTDTDSDGLSDRVEVEVYHSNPALKDSDGDGYYDAFEVNSGFNPALATSTPDAVTSLRTSVEFRFNAADGVSYRIEASTDLENWSILETDIIGQSAEVTRFYSTENQPKRHFRVRRN
jgi:uncharacterized repeat protein (TIGR02543 family)